MNRKLWSIFAIIIQSKAAFAHTRWKVGSAVTPPRNEATGLKTSPCGGVARTSTSRQFKPGQTVKVEFEETIQHTSYFIISFSPSGDSGFEQNVLLPSVVDNQSGSADLPHEFTASVTLPNITCTDCTLQVIQVMKDGPQGLAGQETGRYYSCTDIQLVDNPQPSPVPTPPAPSTPPPATPATPVTPTPPSPGPSATPPVSGPPAPTSPTSGTSTAPSAPKNLKIQRLN